MNRFRTFLTIVFFAGGVVVPRLASADNIYIDDITDGAPTVATDSPRAGAITGLVATPEHTSFTFNTTLAVAPGQEGTYYSDLLEPAGEGSPATLSDRIFFHLVVGSTAIGVDFYSDSETGATIPSPAAGDIPYRTLLEDGSFQNVATYIEIGSGAPVDNFYVRSDVVPTPASLAGGLGLFVPAFAMQWWRRRRLAA